MGAPIRTGRLVLRAARPGDEGWILAEIARPEVHRWLRGVPCPYRPEDAADWVAQSATLPMRRIIERDGAPLGSVSLTGPLGYWLRPGAWGQGIATEAADALVGLHFRQGGGRVRADVHLGNDASARVLAKLGFQETGCDVARSEYWGTPVEIRCFELDPAAWQARPADLAPGSVPL
ncbi:GNAT family N-acetyltransferase [Mangrovicoccus sp. HB161399]|uniref:GNAT family N-acetyltransferase n=1 Tax=Mangrovicoccus sp. HB161399 TaxID=2720392 RepID=UPI0015521C55|nr:GNAT family N-acetyltransferase [Mangrovicoccus sp. HB161399]